MLAGHFTTAILANQKIQKQKGTLLFFLIVSQAPDFLWFIFHYLGLEVTSPSDFLDFNFQIVNIDMKFSHDLLPMFGWMIVFYIIGRLLFKSNAIGVVAAILHCVHIFLDGISGFPHHVFGTDSYQIGFGFYHSAPYLAMFIEFIFSLTLLFYFFSQENKMKIQRPKNNKIAIISLFVFNTILLLPAATNSVRGTFGIPEFSILLTPTVPMIILTYIGMISYLHFFVSKYK